MIFYFRRTEYRLEEGERLGFVFPIYWWGMPALVEEFIQQMKIKASDSNYIYEVCTYGLGAHNGLKDLDRILSKKEICLQATYEVKMVDNYVVAYDIAGEEQQEKIYEQAIRMENNRPVWKENCSFCLKCIHSCPKQALQHGKGTVKRSRYLNRMDIF